MPFPWEDCSVFGNFVITLIARLLQNADFEVILPEERNADGINVDKQHKKN